MIRRWLVGHRWELVVGAGLTTLAVLLQLTGFREFTTRREWEGYDCLVRHFSRIPASSRIVHIDIDDAAFDRVGSWPWPRDLQGELIRTLKDLGAADIVMDIVWSEPVPPEVRVPGMDRFADLEGSVEQLGELSEENVVRPDDELAGAIGEAGNVFLSMYFEQQSLGAIRTALGRNVADLLREDFTLNARQIADRLGQDTSVIDSFFAGIKRQVAEECVQRFLNDHPGASFVDIHKSYLHTPIEQQTADRADLLAAYHRVLSLEALRKRCPPVPKGLMGKIPRADRVVPPLYKLTEWSGGAGFVTFRPDADGLTRRVPLLLDWDGRLLEHLAFAAARKVSGFSEEDLRIDKAGNLVIPGERGKPSRRIQLDDQGEMLINWHVVSDRWQDCFDHRPVTLFLKLADCQRAIRENEKKKQWLIGGVARLIKDDAGFGEYRDKVNRLLQLERQARRADSSERPATSAADQAVESEMHRLRTAVEREQADLIAIVREEWEQLRAESQSATDIEAEYKRFKKAHDLVAGLADYDRANQELKVQYQQWSNQLRPLVVDKVCFVGYTATAVADMVTTPAYAHVPGVLVHSNVFNSVLRGQFRTWSAGVVVALIIVMVGLVVTLVTATYSPRTTLLVVLGFLVVGTLLNAYLVFGAYGHWLPLVTAGGLAFVSWAIILMFRYLTSEREKRRFRRAVAQYVSPAMARQIAESQVHLDFSPVNGHVTCYFSDLAGFTPLSERLGPEGTKTLLNPYLHAMSTVLHRHHAMINKFMGDGIFAFFNPPILPCPNHEIAGCEAALDSLRSLEDLRAGYASHALACEFQKLFVRIGLSSGPVFVGDYGSENKLDYTCMGDTVNLASRLESANKFFGTVIMLADPVRRAVGERFLYRRLGALQVKGRSQAMPVHELLGRPGEVAREMLIFAEVFDEAVDAFSRRDWRTAEDRFGRCLEMKPQDLGTRRYLDMIRHYAANPPPESWAGGIELTEK